MLDAAFWGLIQGLTEFLPISSSGHLVLVPAALNREGPELAVSAVLHLGTLISLLVYFRTEVNEIIRFTSSGRRLLRLIILGTIPAVVLGLAFRGPIGTLNNAPRAVAVCLFSAGILLSVISRFQSGSGLIANASSRDALIMGFGQALALIPGVTRSGLIIGAGTVRSLDLYEAARFAFLLGIPAIAGAGSIEFINLAQKGTDIGIEVSVGIAVAAVVGYISIATLLRVIRSSGLRPFGLYCIATGALCFFLV